MMRVWSQRPQFLHLALFFVAYFGGCGFAQVLAIVPGITVSIWPPAGVFIATLILTSPYSWPWWILAGCLAEMFAQLVWFHSPPAAGFLIYVGNALCATVGATLVNRTCGRPVRLETLREVLAFVALGAGVAPLLSATVGSATLAWFGVESQTFASVWPLFWIGDATGILLVAPPALVAIQYWRGKTRLSTAQWTEAGILGLIFLGVAAFSLSDSHLLSPYVVLPPLLWVAARFEFRGAAVALTLLALMTMALTLTGDSQFISDAESQRQRQVMLQLFLAISAFSALIVAATSRQLQLALAMSRDREREFSQLVDMVPSHVWRLAPDGEPIFFNKRMVDFLGLDVADMDRPGVSRLTAMIETGLHPDDAVPFEDVLRRRLASGEVFAMRYRLRRADGVYHWMSSRAEPVRDQNGHIAQWYGLCHDIDDQVRAEEALRQSERQLLEMIDAVPVRIWSAKSTGGAVYFNKRYQDHLRSVIANFEAIGEPRIEKLLQELIHPEDAPDVQDKLRNCFETGGGSIMRFRWLEQDGAYRWAECRVEPRRDQHGTITQWYGVSLDVDEEVRAQNALRERERQLQQLIDTVPVQIWCVSPGGDPAYINKTMMEYIGMKLGDFDTEGGLPSAIQTIVHPDDRGSLLQALTHSFNTGEPFEMKFRNRRWDGQYRWTEGRAAPLRDETGRIVRWYGANVDINDMVASQEALEGNRRQLEQIIEAVPFSILSFSPSGKLNYVSKRYLEQAGPLAASIEDFDALVQDVAHPEDFPVIIQRARHGFAMGQPFVNRLRRRIKGGGYRWIEARAQPLRDADGAIVQWYVASIDIEDEMRAQETLRERERELQQLVDALPVHIWSWTPDGKLAYVNRRSLEDLGFSGANFEDLTKVAQERVHPDDAPEVLRRSASCLKTGDPFLMRYRRRWKGGNYRWMEARCEPLRDRDGTIVQWYQVSIDIEEEMRAQEALRARERELSTLVDMVPSHLWRVTPEGETTMANRHMADFFGVDIDDKRQMDEVFTRNFHPDEVDAVWDVFGRSLRTGEPFSMNYRMRRHDGVYRWMSGRAVPMRDERGEIVQWFGLCHDIDEQVHAEEALRRASDRLARATQAASLAELSASIAHEVNQPLAAIVANSQACHRWLSAEPPNIERAKITTERITRDANSAADVVSRIRALFSRARHPRAPDDINRLIDEIFRLMADETSSKNIRVKTLLDPKLPPVVLDRVQVQQVLANLIRNGIEAMETVTDGERVLRIRSCRDGTDAIRIEVHDSGTGFKDADRIFDPFFTTKQDGMGMGLAICRSIIESHGGRLWTLEKESPGATVAFTLPLQAAEAA